MLAAFETALSALVFQYDLALLGYLEAHRSGPLTLLFWTITFLGSWQALLAVLLIFFWFSSRFQERAYRTGLLIAVTVSQGFTYFIKLLISRPRPLEPLFYEATASFPSGHTAAGISVYGFIAWVFYRQASSPRSRRIAVFFGTFVPLLIAFSRLYLGVHYLSDVIVGAFVGCLGLFGAILYCEKKIQNRRAKK